MTSKTNRDRQPGKVTRDSNQFLVVVLILLAVIASAMMLMFSSVGAIKIAMLVALWAVLLGVFVAFRYQRDLEVQRSMYQAKLDQAEKRHATQRMMRETQIQQEISTRSKEMSNQALADISEQLAQVRGQLEAITGTVFPEHSPVLRAEAVRIRELEDTQAPPSAMPVETFDQSSTGSFVATPQPPHTPTATPAPAPAPEPIVEPVAEKPDYFDYSGYGATHAQSGSDQGAVAFEPEYSDAQYSEQDFSEYSDSQYSAEEYSPTQQPTTTSYEYGGYSYDSYPAQEEALAADTSYEAGDSSYAADTSDYYSSYQQATEPQAEPDYSEYASSYSYDDTTQYSDYSSLDAAYDDSADVATNDEPYTPTFNTSSFDAVNWVGTSAEPQPLVGDFEPQRSSVSEGAGYGSSFGYGTYSGGGYTPAHSAASSDYGTSAPRSSGGRRRKEDRVVETPVPPVREASHGRRRQDDQTGGLSVADLMKKRHNER
ncbi:hypothetical protein P4N68_03260 [Corynebacterium felinum]|uniref:Ca2+/Na+ antiporter n=1 Tax=Corynebacterium felinum TaxID=131318 RepID=A0ABU2B5F1_9CORY|nr:DUF6779 domain-containing protein [Corynebacterium felinum]MDF5820102.1 hypothetical protein [Corynebacterium felinum]MDR7353847.1 Ca2+/Na+ antiporter [Corynebacterium felinum]WJY96022.1 hypothetical protein CFELI_12205 [Corynebacterium felinum]